MNPTNFISLRVIRAAQHQYPQEVSRRERTEYIGTRVAPSATHNLAPNCMKSHGMVPPEYPHAFNKRTSSAA